MPRSARWLVVAFLSAGLITAILVAQSAKPTGPKMAEAANAFLASLPADAKKKAAFNFDDPNRTAWYFTPQQDKQKQPLRKGLRFEEMSAAQKSAAIDLLKAGLSQKGFEQATSIMGLETILADLEKDGANTRNPNWYFVSIFGTPANTGSWSWRVEGHHLSVNVTLTNGEVVSATPMVFGANPAEIRDGPKKGQRTLPEIEDLAKKLIAGFDEAQNKTAKQAKQFAEVREKFADAGVGDPVGITTASLKPEQAELLWKLVQAYANRMPEDIAAAEMKRIKDAGQEKVHFAYCIDETKPGKPNTYRIQGPTFVVEFVNVQADSAKNPANHIHSAWRRLPKDFEVK